MASTPRDADRRTVAAGVNSTNLTTTQPFHVDPSTDRLLINVTVVSGAGSITHTAVGRDQNRNPTIYGVTDDANKTLVPLLVEHVTGLLYCDLIQG